MDPIRRATILRLGSTAYENGLDSFNGELHQDESGRWHVGKRSLEAWLQAHAGEEVMLVLGSLADDRPMQTRTCLTCGRDYTGLECPTCRANRIRLRGRP